MEEFRGETMVSELIKPFDTRYEEYLRDESKMDGKASGISFPRTKEEVVTIVNQMINTSTSITVQGGKTGICGGAVPSEGHILNLSYLNKVIDSFETENGRFVKVEAGLMLSELHKYLNKVDKTYFWPPDPTEDSATIGGILATNAQGICRYFYGDTKQYVEEIKLIDGYGKERIIRRGERIVNEHKCLLESGGTLVVDTALLKLPQDIDLIDIYLGSEGMYGIIVEATLKLIARPKEVWGISFFFEEQENIFGFVEAFMHTSYNEDEAVVAAVEYLDKSTLKHIHVLKKDVTKLRELPDVDEKFVGMVYIELHGNQEEHIEIIAEKIMELASHFQEDDTSTWALSGFEEIEKLRAFRHAAPESMNRALDQVKLLDSRIIKLATDIAMENMTFKELVTKYQQTALEKGINIAIHGHVAGNQLHVDLLPENYEEYITGKKLVKDWVICAVKRGGQAFSEYGVGKIKKALYQLSLSEEELGNMRHIKKVFDTNGILNPGNMLD
ncbi:MAG: FAD-binding oxidoreductase [Firmicutes bacterium HGW-Firmicutes-7]|nr:MAG: FAD-binding oxidoreductase [Firmicutes bacterium HGW-Firmicutes-7]